MKTIHTNTSVNQSSYRINRRELLKYIASTSLLATLPIPGLGKSLPAFQSFKGVDLHRPELISPDWMIEARIFGLSVTGPKIDTVLINKTLDSAIKHGANVIEADSRLSDYLSDEEFEKEIQLIAQATQLIHDRGLKVVWYIPSLEVITANGRFKEDTLGRQHPEWLQLSFDRKQRGVFYGQKAFWIEPNDESAWMCPNSPYQDWFFTRIRALTKTGVDGIWFDVPLFGLLIAAWGCACNFCQQKFNEQTGMEFPTVFDLRDQRFWRFVQWRHQTLTEFMERCRQVVSSINPDTVTIAEVVALDHLGATIWGTEGSQMSTHYVVWELDGVSEATSMASASYDDWVAQFSRYKFCRGATMGRPSWAFSYGYNAPDAQLVMASCFATQNNPYELRTPKMTTTVGMEFRGMMYNWMAKHSKQIFRSKSIAPVAIIYSARNRDFLDTSYTGGKVVDAPFNRRDQLWLGSKIESPRSLEYMGDYRGLCLLLYQNQIPTDIYPISRVDDELINNYPVLVLPYMAMLDENEKTLLLKAVINGSTLIVTGEEPGMWNIDGKKRETSFWGELLPKDIGNKPYSHKLGKGSICFWCDNIGQNFIRTHSKDVSTPILKWVKDAGVEPWLDVQHKVIVQPYVYEDSVIIHVLNYEWTGHYKNEPKSFQTKLIIPWEHSKPIKSIIHSEPQFNSPKTIAYSLKHNKLEIPLTVGINALVVINT